MKPVRVLQVVTIMNRGGLETMLMNYYRKIDRRKIQFDFMVHRFERGSYDDEIESLGGIIYRMSPIRPGKYRKYFKELDNFFDEHKEYKVIHSHINENSAFVLRAAKNANIPCRIAHNHVAGLGLDYKFPFRMYARLFLKSNANRYFACSKEAGKWLFGESEVESGNVTVINNAIDLEMFSPNTKIRNTMREDLDISDKFVIGHVGRFSKSKNHEFLINVFYEVYKKNNKSILLLVGEGEEIEKIKGKVKKLGIEDCVIFTGLRSDIYNVMQCMDVFVFPSYFEALPVVLIEAQAIGLKAFVSTGVPKEADLTNTIEFLSLDLSAEKWSEKILSSDINRFNNKDILLNKGYSILDNVTWLSNYYLSQ